MSGKLTAQDVRIILLELDLAEKYRELPGTHGDSIRHIREMLLRASLGGVTVETEEKS